jgi:CO/xanthine dehydrogenase FAD-binding subunit
MHRFDYHAPRTLDEAVSLLKQNGDGVRLLAGGTDLLVHMKEGGLHPPAVVSLHALDELRGIDSTADGLRIGALTDMATIASHTDILGRYSALADGAGVVGSMQTRNMATLGGNIANAAPSADTAPGLIVLDAEAEIAGPNGKRQLPVGEVFAGPGKTVLSGHEVITAFHVPFPLARTGSVYQRHTPRKIMDIAAVGVGVRLTLDDDKIGAARICLGAVAPTPIRATEAEAALTGQAPSDETFARAAGLAKAAASPISDARGSAEFRSYLVETMTKRCLEIALEGAKAG